jgi:hypothetical protein
MDRYNTVDTLKTIQNKPYYRSRVYPNIPLSVNDIYVIITVGDRLDYLAYTYYNDSTLWWIISMANNNITRGSLFPTPGTQLRIPQNISGILTQFDKFNKAR